MPRNFWYATLAGLILFVLDRISRTLAFHWGNKEIIPRLIKSLPTENFGVALGINLPNGRISTIVISLVLLLVVVALAFQAYKTKNFYVWLSTNLIFLGAFSNLLDRIFYGSVRDFLKFSFSPTTNNLGDLMVLVGARLLIITFHTNSHKLKKL